MNKIFAIALLTSVSNLSLGATIADTTYVDDFNYVQSVQRKTINYDYRSVEVDGRDVLLEVAPNSGVQIGFQAGVDYFNFDVTPTVGVEVGWLGRRFGFAGTVSAGIAKYNDESDKAGQKYISTNFNGALMVRLFDFPSKYLHQKEVWLVGEFGYKVRQNFNVYTTDGYYGDLSVEVKGSTMTYGLGLRFNFKNYMKKSNFYVKLMAYTGHEYFMNGSETRFGASATLGFNFICGKTMKNHKAINAIFGSEKGYKDALKVAKSY